MNENLPLGKRTDYHNSYNPDLLAKIKRSDAREKIGIFELPFKGVDIWNCYEVSWLSSRGKPQTRIMTFEIDIKSKYIVESKSLKLYLNSLNSTRFESEGQVKNIIENDVGDLVECDIKLHLIKIEDKKQAIYQRSDICIDNIDIEVSNYTPNPELLKFNLNKTVSESLYSNLLKSNCLVTNQPDWGSISIQYTGYEIDHESLLRYIISFRNHNEFHEQCVERIYYDIMNICKPKILTIYARYTRRGGIDINPYRTNHDIILDMIKDPRQ